MGEWFPPVGSPAFHEGGCSVANKQFYTLEATRQQATERQDVYALSVIHLFQSSLTPTGSTTKAELEAAEADYDTYAPLTFTAWNDPILAPGTGYMIASPLVQFAIGLTDPVVSNVIGGFWFEDADGNVRGIGTYDPTLPMGMAGQGIDVNLIDLFPTGYNG